MVKTIVVSNTSPLINLGKADALNLIPLLFSNEKFDVVVPAEVVEEIRPPLNNKVMSMQEDGQIIIPPPFMSSVMNNVIPIAHEIALNAKTWNPEQHYTEAYVIVRGEMAKLSLGSAFVLIDEIIAKTIAKQKGLRVMNHIDIIKECVNKGILTPNSGLEMIETLVSKGVKYKQGALDNFRIIWS
jgi:predicted nucleic acid-binding protein